MIQDSQDAAVRHMTRPHHKEIVYNNINPIIPRLREIDTSSTPATKYKELITDVFRDQLREGLHDSEAKRACLHIQNQRMKAQYKMMCDRNALLEQNQINLRKDYYNAIKDQQTRREHTFVDEFRTKNNRIDEYVRGSQGSNLFYQLQDEYDNFKRSNVKTYRDALEERVVQKELAEKQRKQQKQNQISNRKRIQEYLGRLDRDQKKEQASSRMHYREELDKLVQAKSPRRKSGLQIVPHQRHNPITNPIDHHIENPYIMKKIMERMNR